MTTEYKLLITGLRGKLVSVLWDGKRPVQWTVDEDASPDSLRPGGIYVGRVKNIVKNIGAAFVEIAEGRMCYLSLEHSERAMLCAAPGGLGPLHADGQLHAGDMRSGQVEREAIKTKQAAVTAAFHLTGKFAVLVHGKPIVGVSSKIAEPKRREELKEFFSARMREGCGWIVRTNAASASAEELACEAEALLARYESIAARGIHRAAFSVLEEPKPPWLGFLQESFAGQIREILTDIPAVYSELAKCLGEAGFRSSGQPALTFCEEGGSLVRQYSLERHLAEALNPRVWLKRGASLVIEPTEALTSIDVNTGRAVRERGRREDHFLKINLEAAGEIARQIRLRNLSGIIIVDFIGMEKEASRKELLAQLREYLEQDPVRAVLVDMTPLQLAEITRKKVRRPIYEEFHIGGRGENGQGG